MLGDPTKNQRDFVLEPSFRVRIRLGVAPLGGEEFRLCLRMKNDLHWPVIARALAKASSSGIP